MITDSQHGLDHIWIIGDDFSCHTVQQHFNNPRKEDSRSPFYSFSTFEVTESLSSKYKSSNPSVMGRIVNNVVYGLNKHKKLPKIIVLVPDDDLVRGIHCTDVMLIQISMITEWVVGEIVKAIEMYKEVLPLKCKRPNFPYVLWIAPPTHCYFGDSDNKRREVQTECLERIAKIHENFSVLKVIKYWDHNDSNAFIYDSYRFKAEGLKKYWLGVDAAIRFCNVVILPKLTAAKHKLKFNRNRS